MDRSERCHRKAALRSDILPVVERAPKGYQGKRDTTLP